MNNKRNGRFEDMSPEYIFRHLTGVAIGSPKDYTYIITGKTGPTGKTWLCNRFILDGYKAVEITQGLMFACEYLHNGNEYSINADNRTVVIILNRPLKKEK